MADQPWIKVTWLCLTSVCTVCLIKLNQALGPTSFWPTSVVPSAERCELSLIYTARFSTGFLQRSYETNFPELILITIILSAYFCILKFILLFPKQAWSLVLPSLLTILRLSCVTAIYRDWKFEFFTKNFLIWQYSTNLKDTQYFIPRPVFKS